MTMPTAYSYVRFSTPEQIKGDSARRQLELSQKYADSNGLTLDDSLQLKDLGVSAFKSDNVTIGKLGFFLSAIESGVVKAGSYLLVESLDRLSRAEIVTALNQLLSITSADITIVTLLDNRVYTKDNINDVGNLMYSLMIMSRAHEESLIKSKRLKAAWENKRKEARLNGHKLTKTCPAWVELKNNEFHLIPDRAKVVKEIFQMALDGLGYVSIAKRLNLVHQNTFNAFGKSANGWYSSTIVRILKNTSVFGQFTPHIYVNNKRVPQEPIDNYFPTIISIKDFYAVQAAITSRQGKGGEVGARVNIFANIIKCGKCGNSAIRRNKSGKQASIDKYYPWVALACNSGLRGTSDCGSTFWKLDELEQAILNELSELDVNSVLDNKSSNQNLMFLKNNIESLAEQISKVKDQQSRLVDALSNGETGLSVITDRIRELTIKEQDLSDSKDTLAKEYDLEFHRLSALTRSVEEIKRLTDKLDDNDVRIKLQTEVRRLVKKVVLHFKIKKFVIYYHKPKVVIKFKDGRSISFVD